MFPRPPQASEFLSIKSLMYQIMSGYLYPLFIILLLYREGIYHYLHVYVEEFIDKNSETCGVIWFNFRFVDIAFHNFMRSPCESIVIHVQVHIYP